MTRVLVGGGTGRLGSLLADAIRAADDLVLAGIVARSVDDPAEGAHPEIGAAIAATAPTVLLDVTAPDAAEPHCLAAVGAGLPIVLGTTGMSADGRSRVEEAALAAGVPVLAVPNFSISAVLMMRFAAEAARAMPDCAIVEEHHPGKADRPSGTAARTADLVERATGRRPEISSLRIEGVVANQSVVFGAEDQTLELRSVTTSRRAFVPGALLAVRRVGELPPGWHDGLDAVLD